MTQAHGVNWQASSTSLCGWLLLGLLCCAGINVYTKCDHAAQRRASHPASSFVHTLRKGRASLFSYTNTPDGWGHTTKFSSSKRFEPFDKDKVPQPSPSAVVTHLPRSRLDMPHSQLSYPSLGAYETNVSTVELPTPSITRPSAQPRRPRVTAPAAGTGVRRRLGVQLAPTSSDRCSRTARICTVRCHRHCTAVGPRQVARNARSGTRSIRNSADKL